MAAKRPFRLLPKVNQVDIAVHISQKKAAGNFFLKRAKEYFFVRGPST